MIYVINNGDDEDDNAEVHITSIKNIWNHFSKQCVQFQFDLCCLKVAYYSFIRVQEVYTTNVQI